MDSSVHSVTLLQQSNHKKRRKITDHTSLLPCWTSQTEQRLYSSKLLHALRRNNPISARDVQASADRVLAATSKGRTRWSRAILANPLGRWKQKQSWQHKKIKKYSAANRLMKKKRTPEFRKKVPPVQKKARVLGRIIPGCRKVSLPKLLEETGDYISALEMQVRAMKALADLLAASAPPPAPIGLS